MTYWVIWHWLGQIWLYTHVLFSKCHDMGLSEIRNCNKVMSWYVCWFVSSKASVHADLLYITMYTKGKILLKIWLINSIVLLLFVNEVFLDLNINLNAQGGWYVIDWLYKWKEVISLASCVKLYKLTVYVQYISSWYRLDLEVVCFQ